MILLSPADVTTVTKNGPGGSTTTTTDTLLVSQVTIDLVSGAMYATILRGTGTPFVPNMTPLQLTVNPDGSFIADDNSWSGSVSAAPALIASLKAQFDQFVVASSVISGTVV